MANGRPHALRVGLIGLLGFVVAGCGDKPVLLQIDGNWNLRESFEDPLHLVACNGEGAVVIIQPMSSGVSTDAGTPSASFSAAAGVETDCTSLDGPFNYFGNGTFTQGALTPGRIHKVRWSGTVNDAVCEYEGAVSGDDVYGLEMSGTLSCVLTDPGVTFNFEGTWEAHSARSEWCSQREESPGCT